MFNHLDPGTSEQDWLASSQWERVGDIAADNFDELVVVAAHPDDETLGAGGLLARTSARGIRTRIIFATDGEGSHPASSSHTPSDLRRVRRVEAADAVRILAPLAEIVFLGIPDGQIRDNSEQLRQQLDEFISAKEGVGTLVVAPWRNDGHPDHDAAGDIAAAVAQNAGVRFLEYPIWMWHWATPQDSRVPWAQMLRLQLEPSESSTKAEAMRAHVSQTRPLSAARGDEALLSAEMQAHFGRNVETFIEMPSTGDATSRSSLVEEFFDEFYEGKDDPWGFESRWYEERKRALTLAALPRPRFTSALELGCSTGMLTSLLTERCDRLLAVDIAAAPLEVARQRLKSSSSTSFVKMVAPQEWPDGSFDLIVLSEVGYYWNELDLHRTLDRIDGSLTANGVLIACHWRHDVPEYPLSGDEVHAALLRSTGLVRTVHHIEDDFLLEVFVRPPAVSVAQETGVK